jgi:TolB-like protein
MRESLLTAHSIVVLPFLDLDTVTGDAPATQSVADFLQTQLEALGPARVITGNIPSWSGIENIRKIAQENRGRTVLTGTIRNVNGRKRISLRLLNAAGDPLFRTALDPTQMSAGSSRNPRGWAVDIHKILNAKSWSSL